MLSQWRLAAGLLLIQVIVVWGRSRSSYRSSYSRYSSSYFYYSSSYSPSAYYDSACIGGMPFPDWAKSKKGAIAVCIFYNLTDKGPPYRDTYSAITNGELCTNNFPFDADNNSTISMGQFQCPVDGFLASDTYCCGPAQLQFCCGLLDDSARYNQVISVPITAAIVLAGSIYYFIRWYKIRAARIAAALSHTTASITVAPAGPLEMGPAADVDCSSSLNPPMPPPPPYIIDSALHYPDGAPPPPAYAAGDALYPTYGATQPGYYSYTSPHPSVPPVADHTTYGYTEQTPPSYDEVTRSPLTPTEVHIDHTIPTQ